jgi:Fic family protein
MNVDSRTLEEMLDEIVPEEFQEGDLTVKMVREKYGISRWLARSQLDELVESGAARVFKGRANGNTCLIWRKIE